MYKIPLIILILLLTLNGFGQNDSFVANTLYLGLNDTSLLPKGYSNDSIVITNNPEIDSIFKHYGVKTMSKVYETYSFDNILDSLYVIHCDSNQYELWDTLTKYNTLNGNSKFRITFLIRRGSDEEFRPNDFIDDPFATNHLNYLGHIYLNTIHAKEAWEVLISHMKQKTIVGIADYKGFQINHEDLIKQNLPNRLSQTDLIPTTDHGTFCAGQVAMENNNGKGSCSLGGFNTLLTYYTYDDVKEKNFLSKNFMDWVIHDQPKVISCSFGWGSTRVVFPLNKDPFQKLFDKLHAMGIIVVAGAGYWDDNGQINSNLQGKDNYPACIIM